MPMLRRFVPARGLAALCIGAGLAAALPVIAAAQSGGQPALPDHMTSLSDPQQGQPSPDFYAPPQASNPVQKPNTIVETPNQASHPNSANNGGPPLPPLPPGVTGVNFSAALEQALPATPQEILDVRRKKHQIDVARNQPIAPVAAESRSITVSFSPGQKSPQINLYPGNITVLTFADNTGAPWPIKSVTIGDQKNYGVVYDKSKKGSDILQIYPKTNYADVNNMSVLLKGAVAPLMFTLKTGGHKLDERVDVDTTAAGPNAKPLATPSSTLPPTDRTLMQQFVDGVPPAHAVALKTSSPAVQAWQYRGEYFLRSDNTLVGLNAGSSPMGIQNSVSGVHVYRISSTVSAVTMVQHGALSIVTIEAP